MVIDCGDKEITKESKVLLQRIIDNIVSPIYWKDKQGRYLGCNKAIVKLHQKEKIEDIIGCTDLELFGAETAKQIMDNDKTVWSNNQVLHVEEDIGNRVIFLSKKSPLLDQDGNICGVIGTSVNISQQKALEKQLSGAYENAKQNFQQIIDNLDTNIYWKDKEGIYLGCNNKIAELSGVNVASEVVGRTDYDFSPSNISDRLRDNDIMVMEQNKSIQREEQLLLPSGQRIDLIAKKSPLLDQAGNICGIVGVSIDITERKKLEEETKCQKKALEEKDRLKQLFVKNFSHDAKTPFESIVGATQLLMKLSQKYPDFNKMVKTIDNGVMAISKILNQMCTTILDNEFGERVYSKSFNFSTMINEEIEFAEASIKPDQHVEITSGIDKNIPEAVNGDRLKVAQILRNLLCNAIKYSDKNKAQNTVKLTARMIDAPKGKTKIKFMIADTGIGIAKEDKDKVYEYGRRLVKSYQNSIQGIGLGLHMVKQHVDLLGGTIDFDSKLCQGTSFYVELIFDQA